MKYSVIDISSSSLSMIVAEADDHKTEIVFKDRVSLSLLHYLDGKMLSERGIEKLVEGLKGMKEKCEQLGARYCYLISTAALRVIENCDEVGKIVEEKTGLAVNFTDGKTEAYCDYVANLYYASYERAVLIDLGGKSLEICDLTKGRKEDMMCLNFGLLDMHRKFIKRIQPNEKEAKDIKKFLSDKFEDAKLPKKEVFSTAVMVGATNRAVYDIYADFADIKPDDGVKTIEYKKFKKLVAHLLSDAERSTLILNNAPEKLYLIGPAIVVLKTLFKRFGVRHIVVSDRGVKEGFLQLVLEGKESGRYYDFENKCLGGTERELPKAVSDKKKADKKEVKAEKEEKKAAKKEQQETEEKKKPAGKKNAEKGTRANKQEAEKTLAKENASEPKEEVETSKTEAGEVRPAEKAEEKEISVSAPAKRRGRPRKTAAAAPAAKETSGQAENKAENK